MILHVYVYICIFIMWLYNKISLHQIPQDGQILGFQNLSLRNQFSFINLLKKYEW